MPWPSWLFWRDQMQSNDSSSNSNDTDNGPSEKPDSSTTSKPHSPSPKLKPRASWENSLNATDWSHYTSPQAITMSVITTLATLVLIRLYKIHLRRIPTADYVKPSLMRKRSLYGYVTSVGDGDNFRFFHTPGGRLLGWGWLTRHRRLQGWKPQDFREKTLSIRIAGVDAPEAAHFGRPAQPYSQEALEWLRGFVLHRFVRVWPYRQDQYGRIVSSVQRRRWWVFNTDVGLEMLRRGLGTVYEAKFGSEFGHREKEYHAAEAKAKADKVGMWQEPGIVGKILGRKKQKVESPREYKTRIKHQEENAKTAEMAK